MYNEILLSHKQNKMMPCAATWTALEMFTLSAVSQRKTNTM